ncbi:GNAT family N-acetyltransferase [Maricaulis sp. CAU 1757]
MDMTFSVEEADGRGRYLAHVPGHEETGQLTFTRPTSDAIIVDHVGVPASLEGKGVGTALTRHVVEQARSQNFRIVPVCPFVKAMARRYPDWQDVIVSR